jgi:signal transduction histidine kinase/CheY-like chemotaxis protein
LKILHILLLLFCVTVQAQKPLFNSQVHYKVDDGLPQSFVSSIIQDHDGFVWFGTLGGLARYDGKNFIYFLPSIGDTNSVLSSTIISIQKGAGSAFMMGYENWDYEMFDPLKQRVVSKDVTKWMRSQKLLQTELLDSRGRWWMRDNKANLILAVPEKKKIIRLAQNSQGFSANDLVSLVEDTRGNVWGFHGLGICRYDSVGRRFDLMPYGLPFSPSRKLSYRSCALPDGRVVISDHNRLIVFDPDKGKMTAVSIPGTETMSVERPLMQVGPDNNLYFVAGSSVYRWLQTGNYELVWKVPDSFEESKEVVSMFVDSTNVLWVGTDANGVYKVNLSAFSLFASSYENNFHSDVLSVLPGFSKKEPTAWAREKWSYGFRYHYMQSGALICSMGKKPGENIAPVVLKYHQGRWASLPMPAGEHADIAGLTSIGESIYAIDYQGGLWCWKNPDVMPEFVDFGKIVTLPAVIGLATDGNSFVVLTQREGIFKFRNNKLIKWYKANEPRKSTIPFVVRYFTGMIPNPSDKNRFWIGTMGDGLIDWHAEKGFLQVLNEKNGLPSAVIYAMATDQQQRMWVGTNKGLSVVSSDHSKVHTFQKADGLPGNEFNRYHAFTYSDGRLAFGGLEGYVVIDPALFVPDTSSPKTALTSLSIKNKPQLFGKSPWMSSPLNNLRSIELPYDQNYLSISYAGIAFGNPGKLTYRYMLEGYDQDWNYNGNSITANYTGLPPGKYTFAVNTANTYGKWSEYVKRIEIRIKPPLWATWWAYAIYGLILLVVLRVYWKFRENQLRLLNEVVLGQAKARNLQELDVIKNRFFDNITHELRTPLTLILTPLEKLMVQPELSALSKKTLGYAWENANRLLGTINQMLDISKIQSGKMPTTLAMGNLVEYVGQCINAFTPEAERKGILLTEDLKNNQFLYHFDPDKWGKIIFNLLGNAIKFTNKGGGVHLSLHLEKTGEQVVSAVMRVKDTGVGIDAEAIKHIFERFYIVNDSATRQQAGTGIGLALVKELTELMNGHIEVNSVPGQGSEFIVTIPVKLVNHLPAAQVEEGIDQRGHSAHQIYSDTEKPLILVVEDNDELRSFLVESLLDNWRVIAACDGSQALKLILEELPDLIVSDVMMPVMDGYELCKRIKSDERTNHIPVLLLTARAGQNSRMDGLTAGAEDYLAKPFHLNELEQIISTRLLQRDRIRENHRQEILPVIPPIKKEHQSDAFVNNLHDQLDKLIGSSEVDVHILASAVNMSHRTLGRKLKAIMNVTPVELIRRYRLQKAAILLSSGEPVTQVAYHVGFESPSYFSQCFKEQYGISPSEFAQKTD